MTPVSIHTGPPHETNDSSIRMRYRTDIHRAQPGISSLGTLRMHRPFPIYPRVYADNVTRMPYELTTTGVTANIKILSLLLRTGVGRRCHRLSRRVPGTPFWGHHNRHLMRNSRAWMRGHDGAGRWPFRIRLACAQPQRFPARIIHDVVKHRTVNQGKPHLFDRQGCCVDHCGASLVHCAEHVCAAACALAQADWFADQVPVHRNSPPAGLCGVAVRGVELVASRCRGSAAPEGGAVVQAPVSLADGPRALFGSDRSARRVLRRPGWLWAVWIFPSPRWVVVDHPSVLIQVVEHDQIVLSVHVRYRFQFPLLRSH